MDNCITLSPLKYMPFLVITVSNDNVIVSSAEGCWCSVFQFGLWIIGIGCLENNSFSKKRLKVVGFLNDKKKTSKNIPL